MKQVIIQGKYINSNKCGQVIDELQLPLFSFHSDSNVPEEVYLPFLLHYPIILFLISSLYRAVSNCWINMTLFRSKVVGSPDMRYKYCTQWSSAFMSLGMCIPKWIFLLSWVLPEKLVDKSEMPFSMNIAIPLK